VKNGANIVYVSLLGISKLDSVKVSRPVTGSLLGIVPVIIMIYVLTDQETGKLKVIDLFELYSWI
jgi:hypothetical protein